jgi:hypothetical protein
MKGNLRNTEGVAKTVGRVERLLETDAAAYLPSWPTIECLRKTVHGQTAMAWFGEAHARWRLSLLTACRICPAGQAESIGRSTMDEGQDEALQERRDRVKALLIAQDDWSPKIRSIWLRLNENNSRHPFIR